MLTPDHLLAGYSVGIFPMADDTGEVGWYAPDPRAVLPLDGLRVSRSLRQTLRRATFEVVADRDFEATVRACAAPGPGRQETWISEEIVRAYVALHERGFAHSVECWAGGAFAGGLYGVALGGAFFGESMVTRVRDASKVALVHLVERLRAGGFRLLDTQMSTPHLARLGVVEVPRTAFERDLARALSVWADWHALDGKGGP